ncbi:hypothetical protein ACFFRR_004231 [Megaselia abdita]
MEGNYHHSTIGNTSYGRPQPPQYNPVVNANNYQNGDYMANYNEYVMYNRQPQQQTTNYKQSYDYANTSISIPSDEVTGQFDYYDPYKTYQKQKQLTHSTGYVPADWMHTHSHTPEHSSRRLHQKLPTGIPSAVVAPVMRSQQQYYPPQTNNYYQQHSYVPPYQNVCSQYAPQQNYLPPQSTNLPPTTTSDWMAWNLQQQQQQPQPTTIKDLNRNFYHHPQQQQQSQQQIFDNEASFYYHRNRAANLWSNQQTSYNHNQTTNFYQQPPSQPQYHQNFHQPLNTNVYAQFTDAYGMHHPPSNTSYVQQEQMMTSGEKLLKSGKPQSLRDFLSTWNEDEEEMNLDTFVDQTLTLRPQIHVGITVDSTVGVGTNQFINLPDIIIDIEKPKDKLDDFIVLEEIMQQESILPSIDAKGSGDQLTHQRIFEEFISSESVSEIVDKMLEHPQETFENKLETCEKIESKKETSEKKFNKKLKMFKRLKNGVKKQKNMMLKMQKKKLKMLKRKCPKSLKKMCVENLNSKVFRSYFKKVVIKSVIEKVCIISDEVLCVGGVTEKDSRLKKKNCVELKGSQKLTEEDTSKDILSIENLEFSNDSKEADPPTFSDLIAEHERVVCPLIGGEDLVNNSEDVSNIEIYKNMENSESLSKDFGSKFDDREIVKSPVGIVEDLETSVLESCEKKLLKTESEEELTFFEDASEKSEDPRLSERCSVDDPKENTVLKKESLQDKPLESIDSPKESLQEESLETIDSPKESLQEESLETIDSSRKPLQEETIESPKEVLQEETIESPKEVLQEEAIDSPKESLQEEPLETIDSPNKSSEEQPLETIDSPRESLQEEFLKTINSPKESLKEKPLETINSPKESSEEQPSDSPKEFLQEPLETIDSPKESLQEESLETIDLTSDEDSIEDPVKNLGEITDSINLLDKESLKEEVKDPVDNSEDLEFKRLEIPRSLIKGDQLKEESLNDEESIKDPEETSETLENELSKMSENTESLNIPDMKSLDIKLEDSLENAEPCQVQSMESPESFTLINDTFLEDSLKNEKKYSENDSITIESQAESLKNNIESCKENQEFLESLNEKSPETKESSIFLSSPENPRSVISTYSTDSPEYFSQESDDEDEESSTESQKWSNNEEIMKKTLNVVPEIHNSENGFSKNNEYLLKDDYSESKKYKESLLKNNVTCNKSETTEGRLNGSQNYKCDYSKESEKPLQPLNGTVPVIMNEKCKTTELTSVTFNQTTNETSSNRESSIAHDLLKPEDWFDDEEEEPPPIKCLEDSPESPAPENQICLLQNQRKRSGSEDTVPHFRKRLKSKYEESIYLSMCRFEPKVQLKKLNPEEIKRLSGKFVESEVKTVERERMGKTVEKKERTSDKDSMNKTRKDKDKEKDKKPKSKKSKKSKKKSKSKEKESIEAIENFLKLTEHDLPPATPSLQINASSSDDEDLKTMLESESTKPFKPKSKRNGIPKLSDLCERALNIFIRTESEFESDDDYVVIVLSNDEDYNNECDINENCLLKDSNLSKFLEILSNTNSNEGEGGTDAPVDDNLFVVIDDEHDFEISHEEEVPECSSRTAKTIFKKYLYGKYVQNGNTPVRHSNRILRKYRNWRIQSNRDYKVSSKIDAFVPIFTRKTD